MSIIVVLSVVAGGCGGGGTAPAGPVNLPAATSGSTTAQPVPQVSPSVVFTNKSYVIGMSQGGLAPSLQREMVPSTAYDGVASDAAIFVGSDVNGLSAQNIAGLLATLNNNHPIVLLKASAADINHLLGLLGQPQDFELPSGLSAAKNYAEIFALDFEPSGDLYTYECFAPDDVPNSDPNQAFSDGQQTQDARAALFLQWLGEDGRRSLSAGEANNVNDLRNLASAHMTTVQLSDRGVVYQITSIVYAVHSFNAADGQDADFFYLQQNGQINAAYKKYPDYNGYPHDVGFFYLGNCTFDSWMPFQDNPQGGVTLLKSSPANANEVTRVTSGMNFNFGGKIGFSDKGLKGDIVSVGASISHSETVDVTDSTLLNNSASRQTNAEWSYEFQRAKGIRYIYYAGLADPPALARASFQPVHQWIWRVSPVLRDNAQGYGNRFETRFTGTLVSSDGGRVTNVPFAGPGPFHTLVTKEWLFSTPLRYPSLVIVPQNLTFNAAAAFKQLDIAVARNWTVSSDQPWCTVSPSSGTVDNTLVIVTVDNNVSGADRFANLTIRTADGKGQATTRVFQSRI